MAVVTSDDVIVNKEGFATIEKAEKFAERYYNGLTCRIFETGWVETPPTAEGEKVGLVKPLNVVPPDFQSEDPHDPIIGTRRLSNWKSGILRAPMMGTRQFPSGNAISTAPRVRDNIIPESHDDDDIDWS